MINVPSNLQNAWDDVSKDGKIDKADVKKLLDAAAPGITGAKTAEDLDKVLTTELDKTERDFLANFASTENGSSLAVKNGTAKGTFEFVNAPPAATQNEPAKKEIPAEANIKLFEPLTLPGTGPAKNTAVAPVNPENDAATASAAAAPAEVPNSPTSERLMKLKVLRASLPTLLKEPELGVETAKLDTKIKQLEEKLITERFTIAADAFTAKSENSDFATITTDKAALINEYNKLPEPQKSSPEVTAAFDKAVAKAYNSSKTALFHEIHKTADNAVKETMTGGTSAALGNARKEVEALLTKYAAIDKDPDFAKITAETKGKSPDTERIKKEVMAKIQAGSDQLSGINTLMAKPYWNAGDKSKAQTIITELPEGNLKTKITDKAKIQDDSKARTMEKNKSNEQVTLEGLHDVIGNGFWNAQNKEGTGAMFQLLAKQGMLEDTVRRMTADDQKEAIKVLASSKNVFNHAIARSIYDNLSKSANIDGDLGKSIVNKLKTSSGDINNYQVDLGQYHKGMQYSLYNEKEAALTMARGIINREVPGAVLTKFSSRELSDLVKLVDKKGTKEEKETLAKVIAETYVSNPVPVKTDSLPKSVRAKIVSEVLSVEKPEDGKIKAMVKNLGKDVIFEAVRKENLSDRQLALLAKNTNGDDMADNQEAAVKLLLAMIKEFNKNQQEPVTLAEINKFIDQVDKDWWDDDDIMKKLLRELSDGPESEYARFKALAPATLDKIWKISD